MILKSEKVSKWCNNKNRKEKKKESFLLKSCNIRSEQELAKSFKKIQKLITILSLLRIKIKYIKIKIFKDKI